MSQILQPNGRPIVPNKDPKLMMTLEQVKNLLNKANGPNELVPLMQQVIEHLVDIKKELEKLNKLS